MMDMDTTPVQSRLNPAAASRVAETAATAPPFSLLSSNNTAANAHHQDTRAMQRPLGDTPSLLYRNDDATALRAPRPGANFSTRDSAAMGVVANDSQTAGHSASLRSEHDNNPRYAQPLSIKQQPHQQQEHIPPFGSNSQETSTSTTNETADRVFTPPVSEGGLSNGLGNGSGNGHDSSQESQLLQLSQLVAAQEKMPVSDDALMTGLSRKRMADGVVKHTRERSSASPVFPTGHSRNTSTVSVASTAGSRIGELSAELKTRLSYAMVKVNHGWQGHSIDQVESLASQAASPTSSNSTIHLRHGSSASPQLSSSSQQGSNSAPTSAINQHFAGRTAEPAWRESPQMRTHDTPASPLHPTPSLAPPVSIQPARRLQNPRRNSNARHAAPALISVTQHASPNTAPHTPGQPSPYLAAHQRTPIVDPILFSPHQTPHQAVREQDAMEALLFMSSPGNSANLKHSFPPSSSHPASRTSSQRTALPGSQPRKSLPSGRPAPHPISHSQPTPKRVGFERSPGNFGGGDMDVDTEPSSFGTPHHHHARSNSTNTTPRRRAANGGGLEQQPRIKQFPLSAGLTAPLSSSRPPRPPLADEDIDRMLDRAAAAGDSSDSEGEIQIPQRGGVHAVGA